MQVPLLKAWKQINHFTRRMFTGKPTAVTPETELAYLHEQMKVYATLQPYSSPLTTPDGGLSAGETWEMRWGYRTMAMREPAVKSALLTKALAVAQLQPRVKPGSKKDGQRGKDAAAWFDFMMQRAKGGWQGTNLRILLPGMIDGWSVAEKVSHRIESNKAAYPNFWALKELKDKDTMNIRVRLDTYRNVTAIQAMTGGQGGFPFDPADFVLFSHLQFFMNPFGVSDLRSAVRAANMIESAIKLRAILLENYSGPYLVAKANDPGTRQKMVQLLGKARARGYIVVPENATLELFNLATSTQEQFTTTIRDYREEIATSIQGAYLHLMEGAVPNARGKSDNHMSIAELFQFFLANELSNIYNHQIIPDYIEPNYGTNITYPIVTFGGIDPADINANLERFKRAQDLGFPVSKEQVGDEAELEAAKDEQDMLKSVQQSQQQGQFGGGSNANQNPYFVDYFPQDNKLSNESFADFDYDAHLPMLPVLEQFTGNDSKKKVIEQFDSQPPGPAPRPGLQWKSETHRWVNPQTGEEHEHDPNEHVKSLLARAAQVPQAIKDKALSFVKSKYEKLSARYGKKGAIAILTAVALLTPIPLPGTTFLPIAIAEGIKQTSGFLKKRTRSMAELDTDDEEIASWVDLAGAAGLSVDQLRELAESIIKESSGAQQFADDQPTGQAPDQVALAGKDGKELTRLINKAKQHGMQVMNDAVTEALNVYQGTGELLSNRQLDQIADAIASTNSIADLLGRSRVREMADSARKRRRGLHKFSDAPYFAFADESRIPVGTPPIAALDYFTSLNPKLGVDPERFAFEQRRKAFTMAESVNQVLTEKAQKAIAAGLEQQLPVSQVSGQISDLLDQFGVSPRNPQYSEMVFRTNAMDSYQTAAYEEGQHPDIAAIFPCWQYLGIDDERAGADHRPHFNLFYSPKLSFAEVRGDRPFNCRCSLRWVDKYEWADLVKAGHSMIE